MSELDTSFVPYSDMNSDDLSLIGQHENLIKQNKFSDATALLDSNNYQKGFRASLFNAIEKKIQDIEIYLLNKIVASDDEYYSFTEPSDEEMGNKIYWVKPY